MENEKKQQIQNSTKVEEKMYTREEVRSITFRYSNYVKSHERSGLLPGKGNWEKELSFNEWFNKNVK